MIQNRQVSTIVKWVVPSYRTAGLHLTGGAGRGGCGRSGGVIALRGAGAAGREREDETDGEEDLPGAADLEIFPALVAEPEPRLAQQLQDAGPFPEQAADGDEYDGGEQQVNG